MNCTSNQSSVGGYAGGFLLLEGTSSAVIDGNQLTLSYCNYGFGVRVPLSLASSTADASAGVHHAERRCQYCCHQHHFLRRLVGPPCCSLIAACADTVSASQGSGIACVNSTGTTLDVVQFQDMSSTSLSAESIDLFGYNCSSPVWTSQQPCSTISCTSCAVCLGAPFHHKGHYN